MDESGHTKNERNIQFQIPRNENSCLEMTCFIYYMIHDRTSDDSDVKPVSVIHVARVTHKYQCALDILLRIVLGRRNQFNADSSID